MRNNEKKTTEMYFTEHFPTDISQCFLYGAGQFGRACALILTEKFPLMRLTFIDKNAAKVNAEMDLPVVTPEQFFSQENLLPVVICIGEARGRNAVFQRFWTEDFPVDKIFSFSLVDLKLEDEISYEDGGYVLTNWRETLLGMPQSDYLSFCNIETFEGNAPTFPKIHHLSLEENGMFSLDKRDVVNVMPKLSVIVPVYQVSEYLDRCVKSIVEQTYENLEIILIDNGGTDECPEICDKWGRKDDRIRVIHKEHGLVASGRNRGLESSTGELITFCDSDDYLHPQACALAVSALLTLQCDMVEFGHQETRTDEISEKIDLAKVYVDTGEELSLGGMAYLHHFCMVWGKIFKRDILRGLYCREDRIIDDQFFLSAYLMRVTNVATLPSPLYYYYQRDDSYMSRPINLTRIQHIEALAERYFLFDEKYDSINPVLLCYSLHMFRLYRIEFSLSDCKKEADELLASLIQPLKEVILNAPFIRESAKNSFLKMLGNL